MSFRKSSFDQDPMEATGSFTGTFDGDGSSLTGVSSSGGSSETASHVAGADVFGAVESAKSAKGFTGSFDAVNTDGAGKWRHKTTQVILASTASLELSTLGLIFRDQFNRPNFAVVGNDWSEQLPGSFTLRDNHWRSTQGGAGSGSTTFTGSILANRFPASGTLILPSEYMVQANVSVADSVNVSLGIRTSRRLGTETFYAIFLHRQFGPDNKRRVTKFSSGSEEFNTTVAFEPVSGTFYGERIILEPTGSQIAISGTFTVALGSAADLTQPFTDQILSFLDSGTIIAETDEIDIGGFGVAAFADEYIIQGTKVVVNDLPAGFKARLDNDTAVVESGGSASISVKTRALPYATMSVLDASNAVLAQILPQSASLSDGWGGDIYSFIPATSSVENTYQFIPISASDEEEPVALALSRDGDLIVSGGLGAVSASRFTGTASFVAGADVFGAVGLADTASHALDFDGNVSASLILGTVDSASVALLANTASFLTGSADTNLVGPTGSDDLTFRTDDTNRWKIVSSSGHLVPSVDLAANIGVLNGPRPKDMDLGRKLRVRRSGGGSVFDVGAEGGTNNPNILISITESPATANLGWNTSVLPHTLANFQQSNRTFLHINTSGSATFSFDLRVAGNFVVLGSSSFATVTASAFQGEVTGNLLGSASFAETANTTKGFTGSFDAVATDDSGRWRQKTTVPAVTRSTLGLIFRDQFSRADSATVGNDWIPNAAGTDLQDNKLRVVGAVAILTASFFTGSLTAERFPITGTLNLPTKYMVQTHHAFNPGAGSSRVATLTRADSIFRTGSFSNYEASTEKAEGAFHKIEARVTGAAGPASQGGGISLTSGSFYGTRLILEDLGSNILAVSGAWTLELSSSTDLSAPFTFEILSIENSEDSNPETNIVGIQTVDDEYADEFIIQGIEVVVTDLPVGFKAGIDGDTTVAEFSGSATINVKTRALPFATISIFDTDDVLQAQVFPQSASLSDGWGGDIYAYTEQEYQFLPLSGSNEEESVALAIRRDGTIIGSFTGTFIGDFTGSTSFTGSFTGGLDGTATSATSASLAETASFAVNAISNTGSFTGDFTGDALITGTLTGSVTGAVAVLSSGSGKAWARSTGSDAGGTFNALDFTFTEFGSRFGALVDELLIFIPLPPPPLELPRQDLLTLYYDAKEQGDNTTVEETINNRDGTINSGTFIFLSDPPSVGFHSGIRARNTAMDPATFVHNSDCVQTMMILVKPELIDAPRTVISHGGRNKIFLGTLTSSHWSFSQNPSSGDDPIEFTAMEATKSEWQTVCYVIDVDGANKQKGYMNGVLTIGPLNKSFDVSLFSLPMDIGVQSWSGSFAAYLQWTGSLTDAEVAEAHNFLRATSAGYGLNEV